MMRVYRRYLLVLLAAFPYGSLVPETVISILAATAERAACGRGGREGAREGGREWGGWEGTESRSECRQHADNTYRHVEATCGTSLISVAEHQTRTF